MTSGGFGREYYVRGCWEAREETPDEIATRFLHHIDLLRDIDPVFSLWISGAKGPKKLEAIRHRFAEEVAADISRDDFGKPEPIYGYWPGAYTREQPDRLRYAIRVQAGVHLPTAKNQNDAIFITSSRNNPDPAAITYRIFKAALLAMVQAWEPADCIASPEGMHGFADTSLHFREVWMQYLSAPLARLMIPPPTAIVEQLPNGGILMSVTDETFDPDNSTHLAVARDIAAATASLNSLPYVRDPKFPWI